MIETKTLGSAVGIQRGENSPQSKSDVLPSLMKGVIVGRFIRGHTDKPFKVTANNYKALLGIDPFNPSYVAVDDLFIAGAESVMVMRIGPPLVVINVVNTPASVSINGAAKVGELLTSIIDDPNGVPVDVSYEWMADGAVVGNASTYRVATKDKGKIISLQVSFTDNDGFDESVISLPTMPVAPLNKPASVVINGVIKVGEVLTATINDPNGVPSQVGYQWLVNDVEISRSSQYTLTTADKNKRVSLRVSFTDNDGFTESAISAKTAPVAALNVPASVSISGIMKVGELLTGVINDANGVPSRVSYQWASDNTTVSTSSQYRLKESDKGKRMSLRVSFIDNDGFTEAAVSAETIVVSALNYPASVIINGNAKVGQTLTSTVSDSNGVPTNVTYQWMADSAPVGTSSTYVLTDEDKGKRVSLRASFTDTDGFSETVTSAETGEVAPLNYSASVVVNGRFKVGELLTAVITDTNGLPSNTGYQWTADGTIVSTSGKTYTLKDTDKNKRITLRATFIDNDGFSETVTSSISEPVEAKNYPASVAINGNAKVGEVLTSTITDANGVPSNPSYQWLANGAPVGTSKQYTPTDSDKGKNMTLQVAFTDSDGFNESITSPSYGPVVAINQPASVGINGLFRVGEILTSKITDSNGVPSNVSYRWMADGVDLGVSSDRYTPTDNDEGKVISLRVSFTDKDGFVETATSLKTFPISPSHPPAKPTLVLPPNTPFKFKITDGSDGFGVHPDIKVYSPSSDWSFYRNGVLVAAEGVVNDGVSYVGRARDGYIRISSISSELDVNDYEFFGSASRLEINHFDGINRDDVIYGSIDIESFSAKINHYHFKVHQAHLTVPNKLPSNIDNTESMFAFSNLFNHDISDWNISNVTVMDHMFAYCKLFNQPIGGWDVSNVTAMNSLFDNCESFNQPLNRWDVCNVTDMTSLFNRAIVFNQPIGSWNVSSVIYLDNTFLSAHEFNQDLSAWCVINVETNVDFYTNAFAWTKPKPVWGTCPRGENLS